MRLDARQGATGYFVWHVEECRHVSCVWVDDETNQWGDYTRPFNWHGPDGLGTTAHQARRIQIFLDRKLVLINPLADDAPAADKILEAIGVTA